MLWHRDIGMNQIHLGRSTGKALHAERVRRAGIRAAGWLYFAAAPTFATMALITGVFGGGEPDILCSTVNHASPLGGMVPMYLLMSAFHSPPWLKWFSSRRNGLQASGQNSVGCGEALSPGG